MTLLISCSAEQAQAGEICVGDISDSDCSQHPLKVVYILLAPVLSSVIRGFSLTCSSVRSPGCQSSDTVHGSHSARHVQHPQRKPQAVTLAQIAAENDWKNDMVLWVLPLELRAAMPRIVNSWVSRSPWQHLGGMFAHVCLRFIFHRWLLALLRLDMLITTCALQVRNYLMCLGLFVGVAAIWACCIYGVAGAQLFRGRGRPSLRAMARQVGVSNRDTLLLADACSSIIHVNTPASKNYSYRRRFAADRTPDGIGHATAGVVHSHPAVCSDASQHRVGGRAGVDSSLLQVGSQGAVGINWLSHPSFSAPPLI
jgi:hypothetical protein